MASSTAMSMSMSTDITSSTAATAAAAATSASSGHSGMDMGGMSGDGPTCKISMLWNWYTIDACFLSSSWHISNEGTFAVTCIGVVLLVVCLEFLRRAGKEYDAAILRQFQRHAAARMIRVSTSFKAQDRTQGEESSDRSSQNVDPAPTYLRFRPTPLQQLIRSVIHMATFGVAYIVMLLAMYFNGYIIIMIFIGALIGKFVCDWGSQKVAIGGAAGMAQANGEQELTYCCG